MCEDMFRNSLSQTNSLRTVCYEQLSELFLPMDDRIRAKIADLNTGWCETLARDEASLAPVRAKAAISQL